MPSPDDSAYLSARHLTASYGDKPVLDDVSIEVQESEIVAVLGHNGAGKSTLLKAIFGLLPGAQYEIYWRGRAVLNPSPRSWIKSGLAFVPQGGNIFRNLTVRENLAVSGMALLRPADLVSAIQEAFALFPDLARRSGARAGDLSGGQQQLLALGGALLRAPRVLMLDEPSLGLAIGSRRHLLEEFRRISDDRRMGLLVVEQRVTEILSISDRAYVLRRGKVAFAGPAASLGDRELRRVFLEQDEPMQDETHPFPASS